MASTEEGKQDQPQPEQRFSGGGFLLVARLVKLQRRLEEVQADGILQALTRQGLHRLKPPVERLTRHVQLACSLSLISSYGEVCGQGQNQVVPVPVVVLQSRKLILAPLTGVPLEFVTA